MPAPASLIINSPCARPDRHWKQAHGGALSIVDERREPGYEIFVWCADVAFQPAEIQDIVQRA